MAQEIERKFLVTSDAYKKESVKRTRITQGYLSSVPERTVRVRIKGDKGYITIKGECNESGTSRYEWEKEIPVAEAEELLQICEPGVIHKTRYEVNVGRFTFEVDEFYGENQGLVMAEVELLNENDRFDKPEWIGAEVTGDVRYYNSMLKKKPYTTWS
ncbi:MAG: CYTH domain-containing protein [Proteiniphilum sp.]|nr:CYTH domain-containing protein [Proteiniphilum sp.]